MFKQRCTIEFCQPMSIFRKMSRYPVQNNTNLVFVQCIDKIHKILWTAISGCRGIITRHLISPGTVEWMFCNPHQFYMSIFQFFQIFHKSTGKFPVIIISFVISACMPHPGTDMTFINSNRFFIHIFFGPCLHPFSVCPFQMGNIRDNRCCIWTLLCIIGEGIRLIQLPAITGCNEKLIHFSLFDTGNKQRINSYRTYFFHFMNFFIPVIETADYIDFFCIWSPYCKEHSFFSIFNGQMCSQLFIDIIMSSFCK